jgi:acyl-CoA oxidase
MKPTPDWVKQLKPSGVQGHELLKAERANSNVPVQELEVLLHTQDVIDRRNKILDILKSEKVFDKSQNYFMGRIDRFERALAREKRLRILKKQHNWSSEEFRAAADLVGEPGPYGLHDTMFKVRVTLYLYATFVNYSGYPRRPGYTGAAGKMAY